MMDKRVQNLVDRQRHAGAILGELRASLKILTRIAIDAEVVAPLEKALDECEARFVALPVPDQPAFADQLEEIERAAEAVGEALLEADLDTPIGTFRRKLEPRTLGARELAAYARTMTRSPFEGGPRQQRFEIAVTHALFDETPERKLRPRPKDEENELLDFILRDLVGDPSKRDEAVANLEEARGQLEKFQDAQQMFASNFDRDMNAFKARLGEGVLDRETLRALALYDAAFHDRALDLPASSHAMSLRPASFGASPPSVPTKPSPLSPGLPSMRPRALANMIEETIDFDDSIPGAKRVSVSDLAKSDDAKEPDSEPSEPAEAQSADDDPEEIIDAEDRAAAIADVLSIVRELGVQPEHVDLVERTLAVCRQSFEALGEPGSEGYDDRVARHEESLSVSEETILNVDATVTMNDFRSWYERAPRPRELCLRYTRLVCKSRLAREAQKDRFEFLATRLLTKKTQEGRLEMLPRSVAAPVLEYILPVLAEIADHERSGAVMFFRDASLQLSSLHSLDDIFKGGFYLDVRGYKVALRDQLLDADILYAAVALNAAIFNRIEEMRELEARSKQSLVDMLGKEEEEVRKVFLRRASIAADERFEETRRFLGKYRENVEKRSVTRTVNRRFMGRLLLAAGIVGLGMVAAKLIFRSLNEISQMSESELERLSPVLESGGFSHGEHERTFIGRVESGRWMLLAPEERRAAAEELRARMARHDVRSAWITREGHQAIHIANGMVVSVE